VTATILTQEQEAALAAAVMQGEAWAASLAVGQPFRGSAGEAAHRGLTGLEAKAFDVAGWAAIQSLGIWTAHDSGLIVRLERVGGAA
jgi:hypothetical protein